MSPYLLLDLLVSLFGDVIKIILDDVFRIFSKMLGNTVLGHFFLAQVKESKLLEQPSQDTQLADPVSNLLKLYLGLFEDQRIVINIVAPLLTAFRGQGVRILRGHFVFHFSRGP